MVNDLGSDARTKTLLFHDDPDNYGSFHSADGNLYRVNIAEETHLVEINRIDLTTGNIAQVVARLSVGSPTTSRIGTLPWTRTPSTLR